MAGREEYIDLQGYPLFLPHLVFLFLHLQSLDKKKKQTEKEKGFWWLFSFPHLVT